MRRAFSRHVLAAIVVFIGTGGIGLRAETLVLRTFAQLAQEAEAAKTTVVRGKDGWLFFAPELRSLSVGTFWGDAATRVSRAPKPEYADPLPAILDFKAQLDRAGIDLLFVPVPAKAAIYPDLVAEGIRVPLGTRIDAAHQAFYALLRKKGVAVLDLTDDFLAARKEGGPPLYCLQDTHWSGRAVALAAERIVEAVGRREWIDAVPKARYETETRIVEITGDLWRALGDTTLPKERLPLTFVGERSEMGLVPIRPSRKSPVVLLGDSHGLIFHAGGDMHAQGAGLADHLALRLGFPVDLVAVRGSGATPSRLNLYRRRDGMKGKRLVVWVLSVREFTEGQGWRKVPIIP